MRMAETQLCAGHHFGCGRPDALGHQCRRRSRDTHLIGQACGESRLVGQEGRGIELIGTVMQIQQITGRQG